MLPEMEKANFVREFGAELNGGSGALFVGAGISVPSGVAGWDNLIAPLAASRLGLATTDGLDLPQVAQYLVNSNAGNRGSLIHHLRRQFSGPFKLNSYHRRLVQTQVKTVWTTNYDVLLEQAFQQASFSVGIKSTDDSISRSVPNHEIEIIKMHGSIDQSPHRDLVITAEDYEDFDVRRPATAERLRTDLLSKSFLFLGYSYRDPNVQTILAQSRRLAKKATRQHFLVTTLESAKEGDKPGDLKHRQLLQQLWIDNLRRFGIDTLLLEDHSELEPLLAEVSRKSRGYSVYVVGSHKTTESTLAQDLGRQLAEHDRYVMVDGQSEGIGREVITSFVEESLRRKRDVYKHLKLFPNPYSVNAAFASDPAEIPTLKTWRAPLLRSTQVFVCFDGQMGTLAELEVAVEAGCSIVPACLQTDGQVTKAVLANSALLSELPEWYKSKLTEGSVEASDIIKCIEHMIR
ncbi:hypothetical protein F183_A10570 [Bryobacterales bacterium F-183]|nr:hypothetical protein F183_A10570 [Bryobacterales bacterium F-183]